MNFDFSKFVDEIVEREERSKKRMLGEGKEQDEVDELIERRRRARRRKIEHISYKTRYVKR